MDELYIKGLKSTIKFYDIISDLDIYENDIIYIAGSLIEGTIGAYSCGMGNEKSDLDIFILRDNDKFRNSDYVYDESIKKVNFIDKENIGYDIEIFKKDEIQKVIDAIKMYSYDENKRISNMIELPEAWTLNEANSFLSRFKYSICIYNEVGYKQLKDEVNFSKFLELYKNYRITLLDNLFNDLIGNLHANLYDTALFCARDMFIDLLMILIMHQNEFIDRKKWTILKFENIAKKNKEYEVVMDDYKRLFLGDLSEEEVLCKEINKAISSIHKSLDNILIEIDI